METYTVLVLDDTPEVCDAVAERFRGARLMGADGQILPFELHCATVALEPVDGPMDVPLDSRWTFCDDFIGELSAAGHPDLVLADYGYANPAVARDLRKQENVTREDIVGRVFNVHDLSDWCRERDPAVWGALFGPNIPVYLYTYSSAEFFLAVGPISERHRRAQNAFPNADVEVIDTSAQFYRGSIFADKHDPEYYAYQVSLLLEHLAEKEALRVDHTRFHRTGGRESTPWNGHYDVFISYTQGDAEVAEELRDELSRQELRCFMAEKDVAAASEWDAEIRRALSNADTVLVLLTTRSVERPWVLLETGAAWGLQKPVVPCLIQVEASKLIDPLRRHQARVVETSKQRRDLALELAANKASQTDRDARG